MARDTAALTASRLDAQLNADPLCGYVGAVCGASGKSGSQVKIGYLTRYMGIDWIVVVFASGANWLHCGDRRKLGLDCRWIIVLVLCYCYR